VEVLGQRGQVRLEEPRVDQPAVQQHQRFALAMLVVPGPHRTELHVGRHRCSLARPDPIRRSMLYGRRRQARTGASLRGHLLGEITWNG
jgi:hypothetical protein